jgi:cytochrome c-type biogenesis protein CcmH
MEMREEIDTLIRAGKSDDELVAFFVSRHGERILREPRGDKRTLLYVLPILAIGIGASFLIWFLRRQRQFVLLQPAADHGIALDEDFDW